MLSKTRRRTTEGETRQSKTRYESLWLQGKQPFVDCPKPQNKHNQNNKSVKERQQPKYSRTPRVPRKHFCIQHNSQFRTNFLSFCYLHLLGIKMCFAETLYIYIYFLWAKHSFYITDSEKTLWNTNSTNPCFPKRGWHYWFYLPHLWIVLETERNHKDVSHRW